MINKDSKTDVKKARPKPKVKRVSTKQVDKFKAFAEANCDLKDMKKTNEIIEKIAKNKDEK